MSELHIKVNIANRVYPLTVQTDEEEEVRKAAAYINERLKQLESSFMVKDKLDLLAMLALEMTMEKGHGAEKLAEDNTHLALEALIEKIDTALVSA
jgi:cell division protein ZapA (FtsZ GTPase activity inhibitor)